jgi:hypothetical protein
MSGGISLPSDQILLFLAICPIAEDLFDFPFGFSLHEVRWGFQEIRAVGRCFVVRGQEGRVEYVVNFPVVGKFKSVGDVGYLGNYFERSIPSWHQFHGFVGKFQMGAFKPDFVVFFERLIPCFFCHSILGCLQGFQG